MPVDLLLALALALLGLELLHLHLCGLTGLRDFLRRQLSLAELGQVGQGAEALVPGDMEQYAGRGHAGLEKNTVRMATLDFTVISQSIYRANIGRLSGAGRDKLEEERNIASTKGYGRRAVSLYV